MTTRLIFHKFDPLQPAPGGIDTCIRGILKYSSRDEEILIVGVDGLPDSGRTLGEWSDVEIGERTVRFMPVTRLDPGNQVRRIPHSVQIALGARKFARSIPKVDTVQTHRADLGAYAIHLLKADRYDYFIHTQQSGILGRDSDSFWKSAGFMHRAIERHVARRSTRVRVFNPSYAPVVEQWNARTKFSPTWWDPALVLSESGETHTPKTILWVGRLEQPKVPQLAIDILAELNASAPAADRWSLRMVGGGNLAEELRQHVAELSLEDQVVFVGRVKPDGVMREMAAASCLLMTSVAGYEGFPRVLVEGLANGLPAVVTHGADTGGLIEDGVNGYRCDPDAVQMARRVEAAASIAPAAAAASVAHLSAPAVIEELYAG